MVQPVWTLLAAILAKRAGERSSVLDAKRSGRGAAPRARGAGGTCLRSGELEVRPGAAGRDAFFELAGTRGEARGARAGNRGGQRRCERRAASVDCLWNIAGRVSECALVLAPRKPER